MIKSGKSIVIICIFTIFIQGSVVSSNTLEKKIMCGYQGWFAAPGDDPVYDVSWLHWCRSGTQPSPETITFDLWPDYSEYMEGTLFYSIAEDWKYQDGRRAGFFSSNIEETVLMHCRWMRDYGIDGIFVHRFLIALMDKNIRARRNKTLKYILKGAEAYGLKVAIMYDITGTPITEISAQMTNDWAYIVNNLNITGHSSYLYHKDRNENLLPVVGVWGFGFLGEGVKGQAYRLIWFFKNNSNPKFKATLIGGVPANWRAGDKDSKINYEEVYSGFDILSPWTIGRFTDKGSVEKWSDEMITKDLELTSGRGQGYLPICYPGFSDHNLQKNAPKLRKGEERPLNFIPRDGGHFMWSQFYHFQKSGINMFYIAMFDEVDEGTAIFKVAAKKQDLPLSDILLSLDVDGYNLRSDHYLWLTGSAGFIMKQGLPFPEIQPEHLPEDSFNVEYKKEKAWIIEKNYIIVEIKISNPLLNNISIYRKGDHESKFQIIKILNREDL
ncbi:MAG: glycoside hydrolase family 71/99-like protein, partial [Acidobacteriota bacterium]